MRFCANSRKPRLTCGRREWPTPPLFGSVARGEDRPDSDIDIMIEIAPDSRMDLFRYVGIVQYVEELFPVPVDVANREGLKPFIRPSAERDAVYAF